MVTFEEFALVKASILKQKISRLGNSEDKVSLLGICEARPDISGRYLTFMAVTLKRLVKSSTDVSFPAEARDA